MTTHADHHRRPTVDVPPPPPATSLRWAEGALEVIDQRELPHRLSWLRLRTVDEVIAAIRSLAVRGAPAIGLAGAFGVVLSARRHTRADGRTDEAAVRADADRLAAARPTAVNLARAVSRMLPHLSHGPDAVLLAALAAVEEDVAVNRRCARRAADLVEEMLPIGGLRILTHCNTGRLATAAVGTALGAVLELAGRGRIAEVLVDETRPLFQGSRLTAWELEEAGVPYRLLPDSAAASALAGGLADCVLVGADRIAANGDTANKIGTYGLALAAARHDVPFLVVAPESSWDHTLPDGSGIEVEERGADEVTSPGGRRVAPAGARVFNPAFDVTPHRFVTALVSEERLVRPGAPAPAPHEREAVTRPARELASHTRALYARGWLPGTSGNLSVRLPGSGDEILITGSGVDKGTLSAADTVVVDTLTGRAVRPTPGAPRPSAETAIHTAVHRGVPGVGAVVHAHPPYATAASLTAVHGGERGVGRLPIRDLELLKGLGLTDPRGTELPVFANREPVELIAREVAEHLARTPDAPPALLIAGHGVTVWGRDAEQARNRLECVESLCHLLLSLIRI
ncbi:S-methyl-5-thioribose-1-phosphate isomerase [Streptomyces calidiresistens]|uniref:Multifunctional fusion protein n=1 Tax=Streptomyces calidiresistens TaxID=1485586 RepID=A0A7W3XYY7_9ACTN|nr:S-methyl-5-thioribose-1-phosphate isomerase [Streptomyces calidiresistens]